MTLVDDTWWPPPPHTHTHLNFCKWTMSIGSASAWVAGASPSQLLRNATGLGCFSQLHKSKAQRARKKKPVPELWMNRDSPLTFPADIWREPRLWECDSTRASKLNRHSPHNIRHVIATMSTVSTGWLGDAGCWPSPQAKPHTAGCFMARTANKLHKNVLNGPIIKSLWFKKVSVSVPGLTESAQ